jgi:DNA-directed RNA polymerase subunit RPC12/RpoP
MNVVKLKGCRRCGGDLFLERDAEGVYISCLQCSATYFKRLTPPLLPNTKPRKIFAR